MKDDGKVGGVVMERQKDVETGDRSREGMKDGVTHKIEVRRDSSSEGREPEGGVCLSVFVLEGGDTAVFFPDDVFPPLLAHQHAG